MEARREGLSVTAYERLADKILKQILSGELKPGDQLPAEAELTSHYEVSRNTAREALRTLASQGLLTTKRGASGGTFVAMPSPERFQNSLKTSLAMLTEGAHVSVASLVEVRELLEVPTAEMAALRRTDEELAAIRDSLFDPRGVDPGSVFYETRDFHTLVLRAAHNPLLDLIAEPVFGIMQERFRRDLAPAHFWSDVDRDHREILAYLEARDQAGAREATRAHLRYLRGTYERIDADRLDSPNLGG